MQNQSPTVRGTRELATGIFKKMKTPDTVYFDLPDDQPQKRMTYQAVQSAAYRIFGPGNYTMRTSRWHPGKVIVTAPLLGEAS